MSNSGPGAPQRLPPWQNENQTVIYPGTDGGAPLKCRHANNKGLKMKWSIEKKIVAAAGLALAVLLINALISYRATRSLIDHERLVSHTHQVLTELEATISTMKDAETGERGYIITGQENYLEPYKAAAGQINSHIEELRRLTADNPIQQARIPALERKVADRLDLLRQGIELRKSGDVEGPRRFIALGLGKSLMDDLRRAIDVMEHDENQLLTLRSEDAKTSGQLAFITDVIPNLIACSMLLLVSVVVIRDLTARKRAEEELLQQREWLRVTLSSIGDAVIATDIDSKVSFLNPIAESLTGWKQVETTGQPIEKVFNIINEATRKAIENPALKAMKEGIIVGLANHTVLIAKDGTETSIDDSGAPIRNSEGKMLGAVLVFRDITERRRVEEERSQLLKSEKAARDRAEAASRAKDEFVAMISHEIRSPLNSILGWAQILRNGKCDQAETARAIETIERNARAQSKLIEDLMDISRVITGKMILDVRPVEPSQIIEAAVDSIRPAAEAKSIQIKVRIDPKGTLVSGDPSRLQQIVWNLLSNAIKFTPRDGWVELSAERVDSQLRIAVSDSGIGIRPEFLPYVFDRFSQENSTSKRRYGGLGLGLAIVRHLVELHGGTVRADSSGDGQGATFSLTLPIRGVRQDISEFEHIGSIAGSGPSLGDAIALDGLRILIVDDETETRELLTVMLTRRGAEVRSCASAAEALEAIEEWQPFLLVSDIGMPDQDGYAFIEQVRARELTRGGSIPAIALTAYARSEDRMRALAAGFQMHVPKPVESLELIMVIASLTGRTSKNALA